MPWRADIYARVSPRLTDRPEGRLFTKAHTWLVRRSGGRIGRFLGADILTLRTTGRRSGEPRETLVMYVRQGNSYAVVPSNAASAKTPAWWLNLQADPKAEVVVRGRPERVRARVAAEEEAAEIWPRLVEIYAGFDYYSRLASRDLPVVLLEPR